LYTGKLHSIHSQNLALYALSDDAQAVISEAGFINQSIDAATSNNSGSRTQDFRNTAQTDSSLDFNKIELNRLKNDLNRGRRLSVNFRFRQNIAKLDTKALQDVLRLADYLKKSGENTKVLLLGFADSRGSFEHNKNLSIKRAEEVKRALLASGAGLKTDHIITKGYSELLPVACNGNDAGREKNRRVEAFILN
jgi:phosphate transport system substrate-binding protein